MRETERRRQQPDEAGRGARPGDTGGPEPAAGGGPAWSRPRGEQPAWSAERPQPARRGWWLAGLIVLGAAALFWLAMHLYALWLGERRKVPAPNSPPASTAPRSEVVPPASGDRPAAGMIPGRHDPGRPDETRARPAGPLEPADPPAGGARLAGLPGLPGFEETA